MNYLITGACGFIGSRVAEQLLDEGHSVVGIDNLNDAYDVRLKEWRLKRLEQRGSFIFKRIDIGDRSKLEKAFADAPPFDGIVNLAARAGVRQSIDNPWVYLETNCTGTLNLLELCRQHHIPKFVLASTSSLYGTHNPLPYSEDADTNRPLSPYAASKKGAEALCYSYHHLFGIDVTVFRYFTVYGPAGRPDMSVFRFVQWISEKRPVVIFGDGGQSRDFTYVDDIARGTVLGLRPLGFEIINLGSDSPAELMDVLRLTERLTGETAQIVTRPAHPADVRATWANIGKARELLGWSPTVALNDGIANVVDWYRQNHAWTRDIRTGDQPEKAADGVRDNPA
jgi:nucleoside-diphosphate-sugar epimerase